MDFETVVEQLNNKKLYLSGLSQIQDGKKWSAAVRKHGDWLHGYGQGKSVEKAVKAAILDLKEHWTDKQWKEFKNLPKAQSKIRKRVKLRK